jgi:hypothetical protein
VAGAYLERVRIPSLVEEGASEILSVRKDHAPWFVFETFPSKA